MGRGLLAATTGAFLSVLALSIPCPALAVSTIPSAPAPPLLLPASIPPDLKALEAKTEALQISSVRASLKVGLSGAKGFSKELAKLFAFSVEGVETVSPPAAALKLVLFGAPLRLRLIGSHVYFFSWALGLHDGGRPWVELGKGPLGKLLGGGKAGRNLKPQPSGGERFRQLLTDLNDGRSLRELGPSTIDGQAVTGFEVEPEASSSGSSGSLGGGVAGGFAASKESDRAVPKPRTPPGTKAVPKPTTLLSVYFAASGMPVRVLVDVRSGTEDSTVTADFPAINFPYTILPPPPSHVITEAQLSRLPSSRRSSRRVRVVGRVTVAGKPPPGQK
jgi:hypothetical protein